MKWKLIMIIVITAIGALLLMGCGSQPDDYPVNYSPTDAGYEALENYEGSDSAAVESGAISVTEYSIAENTNYNVIDNGDVYSNAITSASPRPIDTRQPVTLAVTINETFTYFDAYEIGGEFFIFVGDLWEVFMYTQARFGFWSDVPRDNSGNNLVAGIATHHIHGNLYATLAGLASNMEFDIVSQQGYEIIICTREPYVSDEYFADIVGFLVAAYPQLFTGERIWEDFGYMLMGDVGYSSYWFAGSMRIFDFHGGRPIIAVGFHDAGSWFSVYYMFTDGMYQRNINLTSIWGAYQCPEGRIGWLYVDGEYIFLTDGSIPTDGDRFFSATDGTRSAITSDIEESLLTPSRLCVALGGHVEDAAKQQLWPALAPRADGIIIDGNLPNEVVDIAASFVMGLEYVQSVDVVKASLIRDEVVCVTVTSTTGFVDYYRVILYTVDSSLEVYSYEWGFWWNRN